MALIPVLSPAAKRLSRHLDESTDIDPVLAIPPEAQHQHAIVVGYGRVGKVICAMLKRHGVAYLAVDYAAVAVTDSRAQGHTVYFGDASSPTFLKACGLMDASAVIVTTQAKPIIDEVVHQVRSIRLDVPIFSRARDADHARHLYKIGVTDAVPETVEASLQLAETSLVGLGIPTGPVIASIHDVRASSGMICSERQWKLDCHRVILREPRSEPSRARSSHRQGVIAEIADLRVAGARHVSYGSSASIPQRPRLVRSPLILTVKADIADSHLGAKT